MTLVSIHFVYTDFCLHSLFTSLVPFFEKYFAQPYLTTLPCQWHLPKIICLKISKNICKSQRTGMMIHKVKILDYLNQLSQLPHIEKKQNFLSYMNKNSAWPLSKIIHPFFFTFAEVMAITSSLVGCLRIITSNYLLRIIQCSINKAKYINCWLAIGRLILTQFYLLNAILGEDHHRFYIKSVCCQPTDNSLKLLLVHKTFVLYYWKEVLPWRPFL